MAVYTIAPYPLFLLDRRRSPNIQHEWRQWFLLDRNAFTVVDILDNKVQICKKTRHLTRFNIV